MVDDIRVVKVESLDLRFAGLRLADPKAVSRLRESVRCEGLRNPVLVTDGVDEGKLVVVDGFKRVRVVQESGEKTITVRMATLDAAQAHRSMLACNRPSRGLTALEEGWVIQSLHRTHHMPQVKIGELIGKHKSWVCRRLKMVEGLGEELLRDVRLGLLSSVHVRYLSRLPRGNQVEAGEAVVKHGLSSRQTGLLVDGLRSTVDPEARRELLADPLKYLAKPGTAQPERERDPRLSDAGNALRDCLLDLKAKAFRLVLALRECPPTQLGTDELRVLDPVVEEMSSNLHRAMTALEPFLIRRIADEREAQAAAVRSGASPETSGVDAWDGPQSGDRRQDRPEPGEGS